jgi:hypothetical protein
LSSLGDSPTLDAADPPLRLVPTSSLGSDPGLPSPSPRSAVFSVERAGESKSLARLAAAEAADAASKTDRVGNGSVGENKDDAKRAPASTVAPPSDALMALLTPEEQAALAERRAKSERDKEAMYCSLDNREACTMCSS